MGVDGGIVLGLYIYVEAADTPVTSPVFENFCPPEIDAGRSAGFGSGYWSTSSARLTVTL